MAGDRHDLVLLRCTIRVELELTAEAMERLIAEAAARGMTANDLLEREAGPALQAVLERLTGVPH